MEFHGLKRHLYQIWVIRIRMLDFLDLMGVIERKLALRMLLILLIVIVPPAICQRCFPLTLSIRRSVLQESLM